MSVLARIFGEKQQRETYRPLYESVVATARNPFWYREGRVPDTIDGRFDMVAAILALVLLRLEREPEAKQASVLLTELFIDDMDGSVRQIGIGDLVVGKQVGRMVSALGGRIGAFREAGSAAGFEDSVRLNIFHDAPPSAEALRLVAGRLQAFRQNLDERPTQTILDGGLPPL